MNGLDLFSGIGGLTKALEDYVTPIAYCENDRYAQAVLLSLMQKGELVRAPIWNDVRSLQGSMLPPIEIIYGGFPCQDISNAGCKEGLAGKQSGLFFEIVRLASEIRPAFIFLENVSAITVRGAERVVREFCRLRYDCRWGILSAYDVGAPHNRERWFFMAYSDESRRSQSHLEREQPRRTKIISPIETRWPAKRGDIKKSWEPRYTSQSRLDRNSYGISNWMDRRETLGNAVVPQQAREAFERLMGLK